MTIHRRFLSFMSSSTASSSTNGSASLRFRCRLLDAARGGVSNAATPSGDGSSSNTTTTTTTTTTTSQILMPYFALQAHHIQNHDHDHNHNHNHLVGGTPQDFHSRLCHLIRNAQHRVSLASLYIGPAVHPIEHTHESELLEALSEIPSHVNVQIVMDSNRGLRQVPRIIIPAAKHSAAMKNENEDNENENENDGTITKKKSSTTTTIATTTTTTSAAEAVAKAIHLQANHQLYLCQVLPNPLDLLLPNPLNEVAGVFHIKAYIVDDTLLLSGANLSEEYFVDRHDRYLQISQGGNGLVDFYDQLIGILCQYASDPYQVAVTNTTTNTSAPKNDDHDDHNTVQSKSKSTTTKKTPPKQSRQSIQLFWDNLSKLCQEYQDKNPSTTTKGMSVEELFQDPKTMAICVPTFHYPQMPPPKALSTPTSSSASASNHQIPSDVDITLNLLKAAATTRTESESSTGDQDSHDDDHHQQYHGSEEESTTSTSCVQLSSAYLNPSIDLLEALKGYDKVELLTAGRLSHGFRPKPNKAGNKGKAWIPTVFDHLQYQALQGLGEQNDDDGDDDGSKDDSHPRCQRQRQPQQVALWHWQRPDWTFHAKGLWISRDDELVAAVVGSSNFGRRSFERDMESNLVLIFPPPPPTKGPSSASASSSPGSFLATVFQNEWNSLLQDSQQVENPKEILVDSAPPLPWHVRVCFPFIKSFF